MTFSPLSRWVTHATLALAGLVLGGCSTMQSPQPGSLVSVPAAPPSAQGVSGPRPDSRTGLRPLYAGDGLQPIQEGSAYALYVPTLVPPSDIWDRIRRGFSMPDLGGDLVQDRVQWYADRPDYVFRMTERSRKYMFHIVEELERRDMPTELALLPFVESAFNPQAVSSAKAAGMWQFMPATGKDFDLKQNMFRDDRRDVLASTRAALDYLQSLYGMFKDWHLALAAYNWGQGSVKKAVERNQKRGLPANYEDLTMPMETRLYVPKLQAIKNIVANPATFSVRLPPIENHPFFDSIPIERDIDVALAAKLAELDEADFRSLNPSIHQPVIFAAGTPTILLPWNNAAVFKRNLQFHIGPLASLTAWAVPSAMRASDIAKRFDMNESQLRSLNRIPAGMLVKAGSTVLVPRGTQIRAEVPEHVADNAQLALAPEMITKRSNVHAKKGDTVQTLAKRVKVDVADLAKWNKLSPGTALKAGQALVVLTEVSVLAAGKQVKHPTEGTPGKVKQSRTPVVPTPSRKAAPTKPTNTSAAPKKKK